MLPTIAFPALGAASKTIPWKLVFGVVAGVGLSTLVFLAYNHYTGLVNENKVLKSDIKTLELTNQTHLNTIDAQADAIRDWQEAQQKLIEAAGELQRTAAAARAETRRLNDIFSRHDLEALALAKPGLIERRINSGTDDAFRLLECASGADRPDCPRGDSEADGPPEAAEPGADLD